MTAPSSLAVASEFPHLIELNLSEFILRNDDKTFNSIILWLNRREPKSVAMWAPYDASPIIKQAKNTLLGFKSIDDVLIFKLTFPEVIVRYELFEPCHF